MQMSQAPTFIATIYVGFRPGYDGSELSISIAENICQKYVDEIGLCVTITRTRFIYKNGAEDGAAIGLINYPRFPDADQNIRDKALHLALALKAAYGQLRVSIVYPEQTITLEGQLEREG